MPITITFECAICEKKGPLPRGFRRVFIGTMPVPDNFNFDEKDEYIRLPKQSRRSAIVCAECLDKLQLTIPEPQNFTSKFEDLLDEFLEIKLNDRGL